MFSLYSRLTRLPYVFISLATFLLSFIIIVLAIVVPVLLSGVNFEDPDAAEIVLAKVQQNMLELGLLVICVFAVCGFLAVIQMIATVKRVNDVTGCRTGISISVGVVFLILVYLSCVESVLPALSSFIIPVVLWFLPADILKKE